LDASTKAVNAQKPSEAQTAVTDALALWEGNTWLFETVYPSDEIKEARMGFYRLLEETEDGAAFKADNAALMTCLKSLYHNQYPDFATVF
jgi:hypothetical protein